MFAALAVLYSDRYNIVSKKFVSTQIFRSVEFHNKILLGNVTLNVSCIYCLIEYVENDEKC